MYSILQIQPSIQCFLHPNVVVSEELPLASAGTCIPKFTQVESHINCKYAAATCIFRQNSILERVLRTHTLSLFFARLLSAVSSELRGWRDDRPATAAATAAAVGAASLPPPPPPPPPSKPHRRSFRAPNWGPAFAPRWVRPTGTVRLALAFQLPLSKAGHLS